LSDIHYIYLLKIPCSNKKVYIIESLDNFISVIRRFDV